MAAMSLKWLSLISFGLFCLGSATHNSENYFSGGYDRRCPPVQPGQIGICINCPLNCSTGYICCPNGCGSQCVRIPSSPVPDSRCPPVRPGQIGTCGTCPPSCSQGSICCPNGCGTQCVQIPNNASYDSRCPSNQNEISQSGGRCRNRCGRRCRRGYICCRRGCGSACVRIPRRSRCLPRIHRQTGVSYRASCSNSNNIGSRCDITCSSRTTLRGSSKVQCLSSGRWSGNLAATQCVPRPRCRRICRNSPCRNSECSRVPNAACVVDTCRCRAEWYVNGRRIDIQRCQPYRKCFPLLESQTGVSYRASCSNSNNIGSRCEITCDGNNDLRGSTRVQCLSSGRWSGNLAATQCVPRYLCERLCLNPLCRNSGCSRVPNAACVVNTCNCQAEYYVNGLQIDIQRCLPSQICPAVVVSPDCGTRCATAFCSGHQNAICREDCLCQPQFYDPNTFERVSCF